MNSKWILGNRWPVLVAAAGGLIAGGAAVALADRPGSSDRARIEQTIRDYILEHPEIIPEAMKRLQARETGKLLDGQRVALETPFAGAWAGADKADVTLVMFSDYGCGYCRTSVADVDRLLASDKNLKIVWREVPILGPDSEAAARVALSAAKQGRFLAFHRQMFAAGPPSEARIARATKATGITPSTSDPAIDRELENNVALARALGLTGTPSFVVGNRLLQGAVGYDELKAAVAEARSAPARAS